MKTEKCKMAFLFTALFLLVNVLSFAQEEDIKNVRLKVVKNNETTLDTSFVMDTDKETLHKKIHELTGIEMKLFNGFDLKHGKHGYKYMAFFDEDIECDDTVKIKKHKKIVKPGEESEVKIIKKGDHEFIIIDEEGEKWIEKDKGGDYFIKKIKSGEEGEYVIVKKKGGKVFISSDDEAPHHEKVHVTKGDRKRTYIIIKEHKSGDGKHTIVKEDIDVINDGEMIKIIVEKDKDGTIIEKKINIMKVKEEGEEIEVIIEIKEGKEKKEGQEKEIEKVIKKKKEKKESKAMNAK